jgi:hypothetical protein
MRSMPQNRMAFRQTARKDSVRVVTFDELFEKGG